MCFFLLVWKICVKGKEATYWFFIFEFTTKHVHKIYVTIYAIVWNIQNYISLSFLYHFPGHRWPTLSFTGSISDDKLIPRPLTTWFLKQKVYKWKFFCTLYMYSNVFLRPSSDLEFFLNTVVTYAKEDVHYSLFLQRITDGKKCTKNSAH